MPVFKIIQTVSHPLTSYQFQKETFIMGRDLRHAAECVHVSPFERKELEKKYWTKKTDLNGRTTVIEIVEEVKPNGR